MTKHIRFDARRPTLPQAVRRCAGVRMHPTVSHVIACGASEFRYRFRGSKIQDSSFCQSALSWFEEHGFVRKIEARLFTPPFIKADHLRMARADGGTPIWLPGIDLEELGIEIWNEVFPSFLDGKIEWPPFTGT